MALRYVYIAICGSTVVVSVLLQTRKSNGSHTLMTTRFGGKLFRFPRLSSDQHRSINAQGPFELLMSLPKPVTDALHTRLLSEMSTEAWSSAHA